MVAVYPVNGGGSQVSQEYIDTLDTEVFEEIEGFFEHEAGRYALGLENPVDVVLAPEIKELPPQPPAERTGIGVVLWSLNLRYWVSSRDSYEYPADIRIFVKYFDPDTQ